MCSEDRLIVLYICLKFRENISNNIRVMERILMSKALTEGWTDGGQTDTQNLLRYNIITCHFVFFFQNGIIP